MFIIQKSFIMESPAPATGIHTCQFTTLQNSAIDSASFDFTV